MAGVASSQTFRIISTDVTPQLVPNSVMDMAVELGYFEREGVDVEIVRVQATPSAVTALQAGEGEMANISVDAVLQLVARDQLGLKAVLSPNKSLPFLIASKEAIATPADIRSFGIARVGSLDHSLSLSVLRAAGVNTEAIDFVGVGPPDQRRAALAAGQIDATTMSIGVWMELPDKTGFHVLIDQDAYYAAAPVVNKVNVVTDEVLANRRADIIAVTKAIVKASRDFAANPELWVDAMVTARPDVSRETLQALAASFTGSWSVNGGLNAEELANTQEWTYQGPDFQGLRQVALEEWVDTSIVQEVLDSEGVAPSSDPPSF
jgi:NitT/TauT family transport system substrate-binding protein